MNRFAAFVGGVVGAFFLMFSPAIGASGPSGVNSFPTIAIMQALGAASASYNTITVQDYATAGDGGGGIFVWAPASSAAANSCTIFAATGVTTGRWLRKAIPAKELSSSYCDTLPHADVAAAALGASLLIDKAWTLTGSLTGTAKLWKFVGGTIDVNGHALLIPTFDAPPYQTFFDTAGSGSVSPNSTFTGLSAYVENFGAGFGNSTNDQAGVGEAIAFMNASPHGLTLNFSNQAGYTLCGPFVSTATSIAQAFHLHGVSPLNNITHTCNNVLFSMFGDAAHSPQNAFGSEVDGLSVVGTDDPTFTSASAFLFGDSAGYLFHNNQVSGYEYSPAVVIENAAGFTENFHAYDNVMEDIKFCYYTTRTNTGGNDASFRGLTIDGRESCTMSNDTGGKACLFMAQDGQSKIIYDAVLNFLCTPGGTGNYHYIAVPNPAANGTVNQILNSTGAIRTDGLAIVSGNDGQVLWALDRDADSLGRGEIQNSNFQILGTNPQVLDLSSGSAPSSVPLIQELVYGQTNTGTIAVTPDNQSAVSVRGPRMTVTTAIQASRAAYNYSVGLLPANSIIYETVAGTMNASACTATYIISTRGPGNAPGIAKTGVTGEECGGVATPNVGTGPIVTTVLDNSGYATIATLVLTFTLEGQ